MRSRGKAHSLKVWPGRWIRDWPWIPVSDKGMLPLKTDRYHRPSGKRHAVPKEVYLLRARIRNRKISWI